MISLFEQSRYTLCGNVVSEDPVIASEAQYFEIEDSKNFFVIHRSRQT